MKLSCVKRAEEALCSSLSLEGSRARRPGRRDGVVDEWWCPTRRPGSDMRLEFLDEYLLA
jgi:hypothetical protein